MNIRWLLFPTVPVHGYINVSTPIARGIVWLWRRGADSRQASRTPSPIRTTP